MSEQLVSGRQLDESPIRNELLQGYLVHRWVCLLCLVAADIAAFAAAATLFRSGRIVPELLLTPGTLPITGRIDLFFVLGGLFIVISYLAGDYTRRQLFWDGARFTTTGLLIASAPCVLLLLFAQAGYSAVGIFGSWALVIVAVPAFRQIIRWILSRASIWQLPTALIGDKSHIGEAYAAFRHSLSLGFDVRFLVTLDTPHQEGETIKGEEITGATCISLQEPGNIVQRLSDGGCIQAVVAANTALFEEHNMLVQQLLAAGIKVGVIPHLKGVPLIGMSANYFFGRDLLLLHVRNNLGRLPSQLIKRLVDLVGSAVLLTVLSPFLIAIACFVKRQDGGRPFFVQPRVGLHGKEFGCIKFRTMRPDAEETLTRWRHENAPEYREYVASNFKLRNDPRATPIGRWLRRTSLDELPQLINVLKGDMSLVGPRPLLAREISSYGESIKLYKQVRPGITGLWQITGRSQTRFVDRVTSDDWYIKNWSFWYDIVILINTIGVLLSRDGAF